MLNSYRASKHLTNANSAEAEATVLISVLTIEFHQSENKVLSVLNLSLKKLT